MKKRSAALVVLAIAAMTFLVDTSPLYAGGPQQGRFSFNLNGWFKKSSVEVHPHECDECGQVDCKSECIERIPIQECVKGKKLVYDSKIRYEYVCIPEVRYRWKKKYITKEIPADYSKPVCKSKDCPHCYGVERWDKQGGECCKVHCKSVEGKLEKEPCKYCECAPGKTTVKVKYWSCVKVPYTIYRQVKRPICVKQPRYEKVEVPITRYECRKCEGGTCDKCDSVGCASTTR